jgi:hypothetical protein
LLHQLCKRCSRGFSELGRQTHTLTHSHTLSHTLTHSHTLSHTLTHSHTLSHTRVRRLRLLLSPSSFVCLCLLPRLCVSVSSLVCVSLSPPSFVCLCLLPRLCVSVSSLVCVSDYTHSNMCVCHVCVWGGGRGGVGGLAVPLRCVCVCVYASVTIHALSFPRS